MGPTEFSPLSPVVGPGREPAQPFKPERALWRWYALLALPFVVCAVFLCSTGRVFPVFWGSDEMDFHWPLMLRFARELPHINWRYSDSATTPLFHLLGACVVRVFGEHIQLLRALNAAVSLIGVFALFGLLRHSQHHRSAVAALLTTVLLSSCYFFGYSFRLLTDNMAMVGCILAVAQLYRFADSAETGRLAPFLWGCLWLCLTILTRQSYLFLGLPFLVTLLLSPLPTAQKAIGLAGLALAAAPFAGLVLAWHGLVPPGAQERHTSAVMNPYAPALPLLLLGCYGPIFAAPVLYRRLIEEGRPPVRRMLLPACAAVAGIMIVAAFPLYPLAGQHARAAYIPEAAWRDVPGFFAGWIYNLARHLPTLHGNSLLFWVVFPCGLAVAAEALRVLSDRHAALTARLAPLFLLALLLSSLLNGISSQKYYDGLVLLFLIWQCPAETGRERFRWTLLTGLVLAFCAYYVAFVRSATFT